MAPQYLQDEFSMYDIQHGFHLRVTSGRDTLMFQDTVEEQRGGSLSAKLKKEWNGLPLEIRKTTEISRFKSKLKTYFFKQAFEEFL